MVLSLDAFLKGRVDGVEFLDENFFTSGMLTLADRAFRHFGGSGADSSVLLRSQAMGGGDASWLELSLVERYHLRALDIENRGEPRKGMYEELARGFGVTNIRPLFKCDEANGTPMHAPIGFAANGITQVSEGNGEALPVRQGLATTGATDPFSSVPLRRMLFDIREKGCLDNSPEPGGQSLRGTFGQGNWRPTRALHQPPRMARRRRHCSWDDRVGHLQRVAHKLARRRRKDQA
jgi:hypothetical protein